MKKVLLATLSALAILSLAACSSGGNEEIASMKGSKITVEDFYKEAKNESSNQQIIRNMIIYKVFEDKYGDKVTDKQVDAKYNEQKEQLGSTFDSQLTQNGFTKKTFKAYLKQNLALEAGLKAHVKLTDADLKAAWESFHPEVSANIITTTSEDDAKKVLEEVKKDGADFAKIAKEKSTSTTAKEDGGAVKFDSDSTDVPSEVKEAAFKLKDGEISEVIPATDTQTYMTTYYIVKMDKTKDKGNDMKPYEKQIKELATTAKTQDATFTSKIIGQELKDANVKIKDDSMQNILSDFIQAAETTSSSTKDSSKTDETKASSTADSSKTEESSTAESK